jgi:dTDP-4-amino-4,6-dideoxygalactose transaminase
MFSAGVPMRLSFLPFSPPSIGEDEIDAVVKVLRSGWITTGPGVKQFEKAFGDFVEAPAALALNSCTAGLHLALATLGIGAGDEVIVPTMTFAASANVVEHVGARVVLVDVEPDTLNISPAALEAAITAKTRAIMVVHFGGHPADMAPIQVLAQRHGLKIIEDAAHALPARYRGQMVGSMSDFTSFSFYATKNLTTGEGGMLTGTPELLERARVLSLHGMNRNAWGRYSKEGSWYYEVVAPGYKYNMTDIQAALGQVQLARLATMQERRRQVVAQYRKALEPLNMFDLPVERTDIEHAWHLFPIRLKSHTPISRNELINVLKLRNIGTSVHFIPLHLHPFYRDRYGYSAEQFPVAQAAYERIVSLPLHPGLSDEDVTDVVDALRDIMNGVVTLISTGAVAAD